MIGLTNAFVPERGLGLSVNIGKGTTWFNANIVTVTSETTVALSANTTSYIFINTTNSLIQSNTTGYINGCVPLATVITNIYQVSFLTDTRPDFLVLAGGGALPNFADNETPSGSGTSFTLAHIPNPSASLQLFRNGLLLEQGIGTDYTLSAAAITLTDALQSGEDLEAWYRY